MEDQNQQTTTTSTSILEDLIHRDVDVSSEENLRIDITNAAAESSKLKKKLEKSQAKNATLKKEIREIWVREIQTSAINNSVRSLINCYMETTLNEDAKKQLQTILKVLETPTNNAKGTSVEETSTVETTDAIVGQETGYIQKTASNVAGPSRTQSRLKTTKTFYNNDKEKSVSKTGQSIRSQNGKPEVSCTGRASSPVDEPENQSKDLRTALSKAYSYISESNNQHKPPSTNKTATSSMGRPSSSITAVNTLVENTMMPMHKRDFPCKQGKETTDLELLPVSITKDLESSNLIIDVSENEALDVMPDINIASETDETNDQTPSSQFPSPSPAEKALKTPSIIHCVLGFLPLKDVKAFRLVRTEINDVAIAFLGKLSKITLSSKNCKNSYDRFKNVFGYSQSKIPFNALVLRTVKGRLSSHSESPWKIDILREVFADWRTDLKELSLMFIEFMDIKRFSYPYMTDFLLELNLTKLNVECGMTTNLQFTVTSLRHVKYLRLELCELIIDQEYSLSATHVELKCCCIIFINNNREKTLNSFVNFEIAKTVICQPSSSGIKLDMEGQFQLDVLDVSHVSILNWATSKWSVDKLIFYNVEFAGRTQMKAREMKVENSKFAFCSIPEIVEKLTFSCVKSSPPISNIASTNCRLHSKNIKKLFENRTSLLKVVVNRTIFHRPKFLNI